MLERYSFKWWVVYLTLILIANVTVDYLLDIQLTK